MVVDYADMMSPWSLTTLLEGVYKFGKCHFYTGESEPEPGDGAKLKRYRLRNTDYSISITAMKATKN